MQYVSIGVAAGLGVVVSTLCRWEAEGRLKPASLKDSSTHKKPTGTNQWAFYLKSADQANRAFTT